MRRGDEVTYKVLQRPGRFQQVSDNLRIKEVVAGEGERRRRYVVCHNPHEEKRQRAQGTSNCNMSRKPGAHSKVGCVCAQSTTGRCIACMPTWR
jgi:hypothetical protein